MGVWLFELVCDAIGGEDWRSSTHDAEALVTCDCRAFR
jgi:hypothetical protein